MFKTFICVPRFHWKWLVTTFQALNGLNGDWKPHALGSSILSCRCSRGMGWPPSPPSKHFVFARGQHVEKYPKFLFVFPHSSSFKGSWKFRWIPKCQVWIFGYMKGDGLMTNPFIQNMWERNLQTIWIFGNCYLKHHWWNCNSLKFLYFSWL